MIQTIETIFDEANIQPSVSVNLEVGVRVKISNGLPSEIVIESKQPRPFGLCAGEFTVPDDFDEPLSEKILNAFDRVSII
jgi:hypothetical protein